MCETTRERKPTNSLKRIKRPTLCDSVTRTTRFLLNSEILSVGSANNAGKPFQPQSHTLTESLAMKPAASVSGFYIGHPDSVYFNVGKIGEDQLKDMALRRGMDELVLARLLAPNL